jgi:predicted nucleotidyltransferase
MDIGVVRGWSSVTAVRREGIDGDGFIVTVVGPGVIPVVYRPVLASCVTVLRARLPDLVVVYVYGSVATGRARQPESDVDLLIVLADQAERRVIDEIAAELSDRFRGVAREVGLAVVSLAELWADDLDGVGVRCFVKHYCVPVGGDDVRPLLAACRASPEVAWAFNHNTAVAVADAQRCLEQARTAEEVRQVCRRVARKVTLAATSLASIVESTWTTDRRRAAEIITLRYPQWAAAAADALRWCSAPTASSATVRAFLHDYASWVATELERQAELHLNLE